MRILHVYSGNLFGGVEKMLLTLAENSSQDLQHHFALVFSGRLSQMLQALSSPCDLLYPVKLRSPRSIWRARSRFKSLLHSKNYEAIIFHEKWSYLLFADLVPASHKNKFLWVHDEFKNEGFLEKALVKLSPKKMICNSMFTKGSMENFFPNADKHVIYCPVTPPTVAGQSANVDQIDWRRELGLPKETKLIAQVSRFEPWKGHKLHLHALAELKKFTLQSSWHVLIVGGAQKSSDQALLAELREMSESLGLSSRVSFLGFRDDIDHLLTQVDILCQPNLRGEPFGIAFIEAMYQGVTVVTTQLGAAKEIFADGGGVLVEPEDPVALARALKQLICSDDLSDLGERARQRALEISKPETVQKQLCELFGA